MVTFNSSSSTSMGTATKAKPSPKPSLTIKREPLGSEDTELNSDYDDIIAKLEAAFMEMVEESNPGKDALDERIEEYDQRVEALFERLAEIHEKAGHTADEIGEQVEITERKLIVAAEEIKDSYDHWKAQQGKSSGGQSL